MSAPEIAITIRPEAAGDEEAIHALTEAAFRDMEHADGDEADLVNRLRSDGDLTLSLVAEDATRIVGHIAFSPVSIGEESGAGARGWYGLGPVSVWPELHRQGIGSALVKRGIADMRAKGARGIVLLGDPAYYSRFGFEYRPAITFPGPPPEYFQALLLDGDWPAGKATYAPGFYSD